MEEKKLPHDHGQSMERELEQMPSVDDFQTVADIFKQLGDGSRIRIFEEMESALRNELWNGVQWVADYRRIRVIAVK